MSEAGAFPLTAGGPIDARALIAEWDRRLDWVPAESKLTDLSSAVQRSIRPGDAIYMGGSLARPNGAMFELLRQWHGRDPRLTLIAPAIGQQHAPLVHCGLLAKVITSLHGNTFPAPGPNRVFTKAHQNGSVQFEDWTMLSLVQRLWAGATNAPFTPTQSLVGSDLGEELARAGLLRFVDDPFSPAGGRTALVPPLRPDVMFVHALLADERGNAVITPPYYEDVWAAFAASRAVVVGAERIVPAETIRRYAHFVRVPAAAVSMVCEVPFGSHPNQVPGHLVPEIGGYHDDYEFLAELREVCRSDDALDEWLKQWVLGPADHTEYLAKLGEDRLQRLRGKTYADGWRTELQRLEPRWSDPASPGELIAILGARYIQDLVAREDHRLALAGVGVSTLATWLAAERLHADGREFDLLAEGGMYGYTPLPLDPYLFNYRNLSTNLALSNVQTVLGVLVGGAKNRTVGVLGAAEVDHAGNINTSRIGGRLLTGSGGGNDIASTADAVVVTTGHDRRKLPERVEFITSPGHRVRAIVTDRAVLERATGAAEFTLTGVVARDGQSRDELIRAAVEGCGWQLSVADNALVHPAAEGHELAAVRAYDPAGHFVL